MVRALINGLIECSKDDRAVFLVADDKEIIDAIYDKSPERVFNIGIAECNAIGMAAGIASNGMKPYVIGGASFISGRAYDFIRVQLSMQKLDVKIIGIGAGLAISVLGNTQHGTEDISAIRALPNINIYTPASAIETTHIIENASKLEVPCYIRVGRSVGNEIYDGDTEWNFEKLTILKKPEKVTVIGMGSIVSEAKEAIENIDTSIGLVSIHSIKPLDEKGLINLSKNSDLWIVVEEHSTCGGLYSAITECASKNKLKVEINSIGLNDCYAKGYGSYSDIKANNGLDSNTIKRKIMGFIS